MDKKKIEIIAVAVLAAVLIYMWAGTIGKIAKPPSSVPPPLLAAARAPLLPGQALFTVKKEGVKEKTESAGWGRDPFMLQESAPQDTDTIASLKLMGIIASAKGKGKAIINNDIVKVGSMIGKFKVVSIAAKAVVVTDGKEKYTLKME